MVDSLPFFPQYMYVYFILPQNIEKSDIDWQSLLQCWGTSKKEKRQKNKYFCPAKKNISST